MCRPVGLGDCKKNRELASATSLCNAYYMLTRRLLVVGSSNHVPTILTDASSLGLFRIFDIVSIFEIGRFSVHLVFKSPQGFAKGAAQFRNFLRSKNQNGDNGDNAHLWPT